MKHQSRAKINRVIQEDPNVTAEQYLKTRKMQYVCAVEKIASANIRTDQASGKRVNLTAYEILLRRSMPELQRMEFFGDSTKPITFRVTYEKERSKSKV